MSAKEWEWLFSLEQVTKADVGRVERLMLDTETRAKANLLTKEDMLMSFRTGCGLLPLQPLLSSSSSLVCVQKQLLVANVGDLQRITLKLLTQLISSLKCVDVFALWPIVLPSAPAGLYRVSLLQLWQVIPSLTVEVLQFFLVFLQRSSTSLKHLSPATKTSVVGFTPHFQALANSLDCALDLIINVGNNEAMMRARIIAMLADVHCCVASNIELWKQSTAIVFKGLESNNDKLMLKCISALLSLARLQHRSKLGFMGEEELLLCLMQVAFPKEQQIDLNVRYSALLTSTALIECQNEALINRASQIIVEHLYDDAIAESDEYVLLHTLRYIKGLLGTEYLATRQKLLTSLLEPQLLERCEAQPILLIGLFECFAQVDEANLVLNLSESRRKRLMNIMQNHFNERTNVSTSAMKALASILSLPPLLLIDDGKLAKDVLNECLLIVKDTEKVPKSLMTSTTLVLASIAYVDKELSVNGEKSLIDRQVLLPCISKLLSTEDNLSTKVNCLRMLGSIMERGQVDETCLTTLVDHVEDVKALTKLRWNACRAASMVLHNPELNDEDRLRVHRRLMSALVNCDNLKVKSMASEALMHSQVLRVKDFVKIVETMHKLEGEELQNVSFTQKYQTIDTMASCTAQMFLALEDSGLNELEEVLQTANDVWDNVARRISPEKASTILRAQQKVDDMLKKMHL